jgi:hypothetical protein
MRRARNRSLAWLAALVALLIVVAVVGTSVSGQGSATQVSSESRSPATPVFRLDADHPTYAGLGEITAGTEVIVIGEVLSHTTEPGESPGVDALGDPLPAIPHTNYSVSVQEVLSGPIAAGSVIAVSLSGGKSSSGEFVLDGAPEIHDGDVAMFFLVGSGGLYYPLAGGAAVAVRDAEGKFVLPADATGQQSLAFTGSEVEAVLGAGSGSGGGAGGNSGGGGQSGGGGGDSGGGEKPLRCKRHFKKRKKKGKVVCVRMRHRKRRHHKKCHRHHSHHKKCHGKRHHGHGQHRGHHNHQA